MPTTVFWKVFNHSANSHCCTICTDLC